MCNYVSFSIPALLLNWQRLWRLIASGYQSPMCCCLRARGRFVWIILHHTLFTTASHNFFFNLPCCTTGSNFLAVPLNLSAENNTWAITLDVKSQVTKACHALTQNLSCTVNSLHFRNLTLCRICTSFY